MRCSKMTACSSDDDFRGEADQLGRICSDNAGIAGAPTIFNFDVATFAPPGFLKYLLERRDPTGCVRIACSEAHQLTTAAYRACEFPLYGECTVEHCACEDTPKDGESSDLGNPSVHEDFASGDEATVVGGEEADHLCDIGGNSIPTERGGVGGLGEPAGQLGLV